MPYDSLFTLIEEALASGRPVTVAIDGCAASGKTTLAAALSARFDAPVVHMDDFFLRPEQRTAERLAEVGGNIDYERFLAEVAPHLGTGEAFSYRRFDCSRMSLGDTVSIPACPLLIVEGSYSHHPKFRRSYTKTVFLRVPYAEQLVRIERRNGKERLAAFKEKWIPLEERYFEHFDIEHHADLVYNG